MEIFFFEFFNEGKKEKVLYSALADDAKEAKKMVEDRIKKLKILERSGTKEDCYTNLVKLRGSWPLKKSVIGTPLGIYRATKPFVRKEQVWLDLGRLYGFDKISDGPEGLIEWLNESEV